MAITLGWLFAGFVQMPIFLVSIEVLWLTLNCVGRLTTELDWCTNLAGPDMLQYFGESTTFLINRGGLVGPYLNLLPLLTIFLFLLQQKIYTPPATDDTQRIAQRMMKFMFLFMGFMFFRVASGLCIYFIASSTWGILERKLLPKIVIQMLIWKNWRRSVASEEETRFHEMDDGNG